MGNMSRRGARALLAVAAALVIGAGGQARAGAGGRQVVLAQAEGHGLEDGYGPDRGYPPDEGYSPDEGYPPVQGYSNDNAVGPPQVDEQFFVQELSPYGEWLETPYGPAWRPSVSIVGTGFRPYLSGGRWELTTAGWAFASSWPFGRWVFHYGRWYRSPTYGWIWYPGTTWAPAWCDWRYGDGYVGWAPLPPSFVALSITDDPYYWDFVPAGVFISYDLSRHVVPRARAPWYYHRSRPERTLRIYGRSRYFGGPRRDLIQSHAHTAIRPAPVGRFVTRVYGASARRPNNAPGGPQPPRVTEPRPTPQPPRVIAPRPTPQPPRVTEPRPTPQPPRVIAPRPAPQPPRVIAPRPAGRSRRG